MALRALRLEALEVVVDLLEAQQPGSDGFEVSATLSLTVRVPGVRGLWVDFIGEEVRELVLDGEPVAPAWDGARLPLPSYLTALAAGPRHRVTSSWSSPLRPQDPAVELSWSCRASLARYLDDEPMAVTTAGLDLFDWVDDFPYPWGSYDSVLVPECNLGAMENPGCVTFSEHSYLFRGPVTRAQRAERAGTILHEMCHMWFGDLVTPRWWEDAWLKESFAEAWVAFVSRRKA